jgi:hypothetical protein
MQKASNKIKVMFYFDDYNPQIFSSYEPLCNKQHSVDIYWDYEEKLSSAQ